VCPVSITRGSCNAVVQFNLPLVLDNCQINPSQLIQMSGLPSGVSFPAGNTHQSFQYTDLGGNIGLCSFDVFVGESVAVTSAGDAASCSGACDGAVTLTQISGGNFSVLWSNGQTSLNILGLCPGTYTATITDTYNCVQTKTEEVDVFDQQTPSVNCPINIVAGYCSGPVTYSQPVVTDNCQVIPANLQLIAGLPSGAMFPIGNTLQTFSYTDGGGNSGQCSFSVNITGPSTQDAVVAAVTCANLCNGTALVTVSAGHGPFSIQWSNGQNGPLATNLCAGNYTYTVSDFAGCVQSGSVTISQPSTLQIAVDQVENDHGNAGTGSIQISVSGGVPTYTYSWTRNGAFYSNTEDLANLYQGQYAGIVTDANGCTANSGLVTVSNLVGTKAPEWIQTLSVSPNPASEMVRLDFGASLGQTAELRISDLNGRVVSTQQIEATAQHFFFDVSAYPTGLWLLQLSLGDGQRTMRKLVVKR
ncbi:MAG: HYR domain-containing protein, partial [Saprospiraceae bacterium]|nr:HYR domain-containing protein [Saprospiraceae bacterium]